jgi:hypothetical protein
VKAATARGRFAHQDGLACVTPGLEPVEGWGARVPRSTPYTSSRQIALIYNRVTGPYSHLHPSSKRTTTPSYYHRYLQLSRNVVAMPKLHQYNYVFGIGTFFALLDAYNNGASEFSLASLLSNTDDSKTMLPTRGLLRFHPGRSRTARPWFSVPSSRW